MSAMVLAANVKWLVREVQGGVLDARISVFVAHTTQPDGAVFCPGAGELNGLIAGQTFGFEHRSTLTVTEPAEAWHRIWPKGTP